MFQTIDLLWVDHLETMDYLRSSVNLRAYGQRDPLVEYKREGLEQFKHMEAFYRSPYRTDDPGNWRAGTTTDTCKHADTGCTSARTGKKDHCAIKTRTIGGTWTQ